MIQLFIYIELKLTLFKQLNANNVSDHETEKSDQFMKYLASKVSKYDIQLYINLLIDFFPDKARTLNTLRSFNNRENSADVKLLKTAIGLERTYKQVYNAKVSPFFSNPNAFY